MQVIHNGWIYNITDIDYSAGRPAQIGGWPENCYPEEPSEVEYSVESIDSEGLGDVNDIVSSDELDSLVLNQYENGEEE